MRRVLSILLIGLMTLATPMLAGMSHAMPDGSQGTATAQQQMKVCVECPMSANGGLSGDLQCHDGTICHTFSAILARDSAITLTPQDQDFPQSGALLYLARGPSLDLPPPRIGSTNI